MQRTAKAVRKVVIALIGVPILVLGIILIPLPGPGLPVAFLGLLVLSAEFEWAHKHRDNAHKHVKRIVKQAKGKSNK